MERAERERVCVFSLCAGVDRVLYIIDEELHHHCCVCVAWHAWDDDVRLCTRAHVRLR